MRESRGTVESVCQYLLRHYGSEFNGMTWDEEDTEYVRLLYSLAIERAGLQAGVWRHGGLVSKPGSDIPRTTQETTM